MLLFASLNSWWLGRRVPILTLQNPSFREFQAGIPVHNIYVFKIMGDDWRQDNPED